MSYTLRRAHTSLDFEHISKLHCIIFDGGVDEIPELHGAWWILEYNKRLAGFCGIHLSHQWAKTAYLCRVGILSNYSGFGQQARMIRIRERWARTKGIEWIVTDTSLDNYPSSNSLINCGYKVWGPEKGWAEYPSAIYWRKKL